MNKLFALVLCLGLHTSAATTLPLRISEASGLIASQTQPGVLWTHNDSGAGPVLFAITGEGKLLRQVRVKGAKSIDWEDIAQDDKGHLWIADTGNNLNNRKNLTLYQVKEPPVPGKGKAPVLRSIRVHYPEQKSFPDLSEKNFDCEALFWADERLYMLTKHRSDTRTVLYRVPLDSGDDVALQRISEFDVGSAPWSDRGMVTAADTNPEQTHLAVLTYHRLMIFERPAEGEDWLSSLVYSMPMAREVYQQAESVAWVGEDLLILNEQGFFLTVQAPLQQTP